MSTQSWKKFIVGAAVAGAFVPGMALADPTCAYVVGHVDSITVSTPAVPIVVPDSSALTEPVTVHVDETSQTILGYSLGLPGPSAGTSGSPIFVPGISEYIPSFSLTLPELNLSPNRCVNVDGVSTPAVPVYIPASALTVPGAVANVGSIVINIVGHPLTAPGQVITFDGQSIVIPAQSGGIPSVPVGTPDATITFDVNGAVQRATYLPPRS